MTTLPRLFISHSTATDPGARPIVDGLEKGLAGKFSILLDHSTLPAGDNWRNTLNVWTGTCDAAVALITPTSIASHFCLYEWSILGFRRGLNPNFQVIPLFFGTDESSLKGVPYNFDAIQGIKHIDIGTSVNAIDKALKDVVFDAGNSAADVQRQYVTALLRTNVADQTALRRASEKIDLAIDSWDPTNDAWQRLALRLIGAHMDQAREALDEIVPYFRDAKDSFYELLELVACSWVDVAAETTIQSRARPSVSPRDVALNAARPRTARSCVLRASGKPPSNTWRVAEIPDVYAKVENLVDQIYISLAPLFNVRENPVTRATMKQKLARAQKHDEPVVIALRDDGFDAAFLDALRTEFPTVMFFLLTGKRAIAPGIYKNVEFIAPPLFGDFENAFWETYDDTRDFFEDKPNVFNRK